MRAQREGAEFYIWGGSLPPPFRAAGPLPPTGGTAGGLPPAKDLCAKKIIFIYIQVPTTPAGLQAGLGSFLSPESSFLSPESSCNSAHLKPQPACGLNKTRSVPHVG